VYKVYEFVPIFFFGPILINSLKFFSHKENLSQFQRIIYGAFITLENLQFIGHLVKIYTREPLYAFCLLYSRLCI
jgi:hypothetical protein